MSRRTAGEALLAAAIAAATVLFAAREVRTPDAQFHLAIGGEILDTRSLPRENRWLAFERGRPFVNVEWAYQVALALIERKGGFEAILALRIGLALAATAAVYLAARRAGAAAAGLAALAFVIVAEGRFLDAPEAVSIALASLFVLLLERRDDWPRAVFLLPPLVALWANVHGFYPLGIALVACYALGDLAHGGRPVLLAVLGLALASPLVNAYGIEGALYPFRLLADEAGRRLIAECVVELRSPLTDPAISTTWQARLYQAVAAAVLFSLAISAARDFRMERLPAAVLAAVLAAPHVRNVGLFAAIAVPLAVLAAASPIRALALRLLGEGRARALAVVLGVATAAAACGAAASVATGRWDRDSLEEVRLGPRIARAIDHSEAVAFYLGNGLPEVVWNEFGTGHALIALGGGRVRPAICGHTELYSRALLASYRDAVSGRGGLARLLARYPADALFFDHTRLEGSEMLAEVLESREWALVYLDARDAIFLRNGEPWREKAARLRLDLDEVARDPERGRRLAGARDRLGLASFLLAAGKPEAASALARRASEERPGWPPCEYVLGLAARARGDPDAAKEHLRRAASALPSNAGLRHLLGLLHIRLQEYGRAEEELARAVALDPANPIYEQNLRLLRALRGKEAFGSRADAPLARAGAGSAAAPPATAAERRAAAVSRFNQAVALTGEGARREAERLYREALALDPEFADAYYNLGNLLFRAGRKEEALLNYRRATELAPQDAEARYNLGIALRDLGRLEDARACLREVLRLVPDHGPARRALQDLDSRKVR